MAPRTKPRLTSLYICYFGLDQPLVQTQVLPYLRELVVGGFSVQLVTFERHDHNDWNSETKAEKRAELEREGIVWHSLTYHKRLSVVATSYDIFRGTILVWKLIRNENIDILHGRVHVPTLMAALARRFSSRNPKLLFDIRGFFPEEYTDAGTWSQNGLLYRITKRVEAWLFKESDGFVVLTENARGLLFPESKDSGFDKFGRPVEVIPCCISNDRFPITLIEQRQELRQELGLTNRKVIVHTGSLGGLYLSAEIVDLLRVSRELDPSTFALIITKGDAREITRLIENVGFSVNDFRVIALHPSEVPRYLVCSDIGLSMVKAGYATASRSPTKIPEYLISGIPVIANAGIGDVDSQIEEDGTGVIVETLSAIGYRTALLKLDEIRSQACIVEKCRRSALNRFELRQVGGLRYRRIYGRLSGRQLEAESQRF